MSKSTEAFFVDVSIVIVLDIPFKHPPDLDPVLKNYISQSSDFVNYVHLIFSASMIVACVNTCIVFVLYMPSKQLCLDLYFTVH